MVSVGRNASKSRQQSESGPSAEEEPTRGYRPSRLGRIAFLTSYAVALGAALSVTLGWPGEVVAGLAAVLHLALRLYQWFRDRKPTWTVEGHPVKQLALELVTRWVVRIGLVFLEFFASLIFFFEFVVEEVATVFLLFSAPSFVLAVVVLIGLIVREETRHTNLRAPGWVVKGWVDTYREVTGEDEVPAPDRRHLEADRLKLERERLELERERLELERERLELERERRESNRDQ